MLAMDYKCAANREKAADEAGVVYAREKNFSSREDIGGFTLQEWADGHGGMVSNWAEAWACQVARVNSRTLRALTVASAIRIPYAGRLIARELSRRE